MRYRIFFLTAVLALFAAGCSKDDTTSYSFKGTISSTTDIYGVVTDSNGNRLQGVVVSDGYSCTQTDANGEYQLTSCEYSYQVFVTVPSEYEVPVENGLPCFWQLLKSGQERYDFTLTPLPGGSEKQFKLFCIADPQCSSSSNVDRFKNETAPDVAGMAAKSDVPCYGVALGDISWNTASNDYSNTVFPLMKAAMSKDKLGFPLFQIIGNHDNKTVSGSSTYSVSNDIDVQRNFEYTFGPINYSFDRGDIHFICMDDIIFTTHSSYVLGFRDDQIEWLEQDLSYVSKDKAVILCVHMPLRNYTSYQNVSKVFDMLYAHDGYYHIMSGHVHMQENYMYDSHYEHNMGSACGAWWRSDICSDGSPNGYSIFDVDGKNITKWIYKGTDRDEDYQIRMYRGNLTYMPGRTPNYQFAYTGDNDIIANVWGADDEWKVEVYEDGVYSGDMINYTGRDAWASGYFLGVQGRATGSDYDKSNVLHLYHYTLKNADASVEVRATNQFGDVYTQTVFTSNMDTDYPAAEL